MDARRRLVRSTRDTGDSRGFGVSGAGTNRRRDESNSFISDAPAPLRSPRRALREFVRDEDYSARRRRPRRPRHPSREETPKPSVFRHRDQFGPYPSPRRATPLRARHPHAPREIPRNVSDLHASLDDVQRGGRGGHRAPGDDARKKIHGEALPRVESRRRGRVRPLGTPFGTPGCRSPPREDDSRDSLAEVFEREPVRRGIRNVPGERRSDAGPQSPHRAAPRDAARRTTFTSAPPATPFADSPPPAAEAASPAHRPIPPAPPRTACVRVRTRSNGATQSTAMVRDAAPATIGAAPTHPARVGSDDSASRAFARAMS